MWTFFYAVLLNHAESSFTQTESPACGLPGATAVPVLARTKGRKPAALRLPASNAVISTAGEPVSPRRMNQPSPNCATGAGAQDQVEVAIFIEQVA